MSNISAIDLSYFDCTQYLGVNMNLNKAFAMRLSKLLNEKGMSKYRLEKETGITHSALRYIFNEVNTDVYFSTIVKVCLALNVSLQEFFNDDLFKLDNLDVK